MSQGAELLSQKSLLFSSVSDDPNCDKVVTVNAVHHSLINLAALPDFLLLLDDDIALRYFDLKDWNICTQLLQGLPPELAALVAAVNNSQALLQCKFMWSKTCTLSDRTMIEFVQKKILSFFAHTPSVSPQSDSPGTLSEARKSIFRWYSCIIRSLLDQQT